jgi:hypothetical protein
MPGIFFTNAWMLAGLAALSVPVVIHLLLRRKKKRLRFSTVQFFVKHDEQSSQRRKLRNWLLLALRLLICTLLVLAFARPFLRSDAGAGATRQRRHALVLLDRSLSMQANATDGPKWIRARESVRQILNQLKADDRAALISCGPRAEVLAEWAPAALVARSLAELQPTCGSGNLAEGLQLSRRLLTLVPRDSAAILYIVSDFQRTVSQNIASCPIPQQVEVKLIGVGDLMTPNLAITDLQVENQPNTRPHVALASFTDEDMPDLKLQLLVDGQVVESHSLALPAGAVTNLDLAVPPVKPGWHEAAVQIRTQDALTLDNTRFQAWDVPEPTHVLVVETRPGKRTFQEESFFVTTALDPATDSTNGVRSRFACEKVSADELAVRLAGPKEAPARELVVLPGLSRTPSTLGHALAKHLEAGGGLLLFLSDAVSANHYNAEFRDWLPAALGSTESCPDLEAPWRIGEYDTNITAFAAFQAPNSGDLTLGRFLNRFALQVSEAAVVTARFEDGTPFMVARKVGRGRVVLVNTSADTLWNDWPKHKTFVPWLHGVAQYLTGPTESKALKPTPTLIAGTDAEIALGPAAAKTTVKIQGPGGKDVTTTADDQGQLLGLAWTRPGVYVVRDSSGKELRRLAVNVPPQESDLAALSANDFQQQLPRASESQPSSLLAGLFGSTSNHRELWRVLLFAALGLLLVELFVANRTLA